MCSNLSADRPGVGVGVGGGEGGGGEGQSVCVWWWGGGGLVGLGVRGRWGLLRPTPALAGGVSVPARAEGTPRGAQ